MKKQATKEDVGCEYISFPRWVLWRIAVLCWNIDALIQRNPSKVGVFERLGNFFEDSGEEETHDPEFPFPVDRSR